jgi:hypothetical protein
MLTTRAGPVAATPKTETMQLLRARMHRLSSLILRSRTSTHRNKHSLVRMAGQRAPQTLLCALACCLLSKCLDLCR